MKIRDYRLSFGAQYTLPLRGTDALAFGLVYSPAKDLRGTAKKIYYDTSSEENVPEVSDEHKLHGNYSIPQTWGAGINYSFGRRAMVEFDYTYQPWSKVKFRGFEGDPAQKFQDRSKYAIGMQFVPDFRGSYLKRINYRLGAYYSNDYLVISDNRLREYGVTAGFGFPVPSFKTTVNLGFEWKRRQANPNPLIKENYFSLTLGINFNEMWFRQNKLY
ncbi:MAG: hypothetical protein K2F79_01400 [Muribaculaceae bacterium]|nr:hypothetical protein [Muribaculaceae bacterium]